MAEAKVAEAKVAEAKVAEVFINTRGGFSKERHGLCCSLMTKSVPIEPIKPVINLSTV